MDRAIIKGWKLWCVGLFVGLAAALSACDGSSTLQNEQGRQQLLTKIEQICLDEGERSRKRLASEIMCNAQCNAELTLQDSATCTCQRKRLERDFSPRELMKISELEEVESRIRALQEEGVDVTHVLMVELSEERARVLDKIGEELQSINLAYPTAKRICDEAISAEAIAKGR